MIEIFFRSKQISYQNCTQNINNSYVKNPIGMDTFTNFAKNVFILTKHFYKK
jgi:hypothetical protein